MLYIVDMKTDIVLEKFEPWSETCLEDAEKWLQDNSYTLEFVESNISGDLFWLVVKN